MSLQIQAEHFFNAFKVLEANNQALIDRLADEAGEKPQVRPDILGIRPTMGIEIVCLAFSIELYIKDVHLAVAGEAPRGHDILSLFEQLPEQVQQEVFHHPSIENYGWSFEAFKLEIKQISNGFEKWRYSHESAALQYNSYFALVFLEALISTASSIRRNMVR